MVKSSSDRKNKYKAKLKSNIIGGKYDATKDLAVRKQTEYFGNAVALQNKVKAIVSGEPSILHHYYMDFAEEMAKTPTSAERTIIFTKWAMRGLSWYYLLQVAMKVFGDVPELADEGVLPPTEVLYSFHEGAGPTLFDLSGNNRHGTWAGAGAHYTPGKVGAFAGLFNGLNDYTSAPNLGISATTSVTLFAWINLDIMRNRFVARAYGSNSNARSGSLALVGAGVPRVNFINSLDVPHFCMGTTNVLGSWHHVAGVIDIPNQMMHIYVDGVLENSTPIVGISSVGVNPFLVGQNGAVIPTFEQGRIDEVIVFSRALSAEEILTYYNITK